MPLAPEIAQQLNAHLPNEARAANVYQRLADDCRALGFEGISKWLADAGQEENGHLQKFIDFLSEFDIRANVPARSPEPLGTLPTEDRLVYIGAVFSEVLALEETVTGQIETMVSSARDIGCWVGFDFLMGFIQEQSEAERELRKILRQLPLYVGNLNDLDNWIGGL